jgi:DNA-binding transcriptional ArsR family regulator
MLAASPSLWRTCRVLANYKRLQILALLARRRFLTVSDAARQVKLSLPTASQYLRALEARGLLACRRVGRQVEYRLADGRSDAPADRIVTALRPALVRRGSRLERVFKLATAFTHPRRVEIFRTVAKGADSFAKIQAATSISIPALQRQMEKLEARGLITRVDGAYLAQTQADPFARTLARLAAS